MPKVSSNLSKRTRYRRKKDEFEFFLNQLRDPMNNSQLDINMAPETDDLTPQPDGSPNELPLWDDRNDSEETSSFQDSDDEFESEGSPQTLTSNIEFEGCSNANTLDDDISLIAEYLMETDSTRAVGDKLLALLPKLNPDNLDKLPKCYRSVVPKTDASKFKIRYLSDKKRDDVVVPDCNCGVNENELSSTKIAPTTGSNEERMKYIHFGILNTLRDEPEIYMDTSSMGPIKLSVAIDGVPPFKKLQTSLWVIMACVGDKPVFMVGTSVGKGKPKDVSDYLKDFVNEISDLVQNGATIGDKLYNFEFSCLICDSPARAFILGSTSFNGYSGCCKCTVHGARVNNTTAYLEFDAPLRKDSDYIQRTDVLYHRNISPLIEIPNFRICKSVVLDYMHLVCLGIMKKLMTTWLTRPVQNDLLHSDRQEDFNERVKCIRQFCPAEFQRPPQSLTYVKLWKATEFRQFLLYTGPFLLRDILPLKHLQCFFMLCVSIRILCHPLKALDVTNLEFVTTLLKAFVSRCAKLYGDNFLCHNVHSVIHLPIDVLNYGPLDQFSAFKFENFLGKLKKVIHSGNRPLEQIVTKFRLLHRVAKNSWCDTSVEPILTSPIKSKEHHFRRLQYMKFTFRSDREADRYAAVGPLNQVLKIEAIFVNESNKIKISGKHFRQQCSAFKFSNIDSNIVDIWSLSNLSEETHVYNFDDSSGKFYVFPTKDKNTFSAIKLLHH